MPAPGHRDQSFRLIPIGDFNRPRSPIPGDGVTGEVLITQLFVAAFGASSHTYAEATSKQKPPGWIGAHVRAFEFLGGVTALTVSDNLKASITNACFHEAAVNPLERRDGRALRTRIHA